MPPERREKVDERLQTTRASDRIFNMRRDLGYVLGGIQQAICLVYGAESLRRILRSAKGSHHNYF